MCIAMKTATGAAVVWPRGVTTISCISYICAIVLAEPFTMSQEFSANFQNYLSFYHFLNKQLKVKLIRNDICCDRMTDSVSAVLRRSMSVRRKRVDEVM